MAERRWQKVCSDLESGRHGEALLPALSSSSSPEVIVVGEPIRISKAVASRNSWCRIVAWGSADTRRQRWTGAVRAGGASRADYIPRERKPFSTQGEFLELEPPRVLVQAWR